METEEGARRILEQIEAAFVPVHEYRTVSEDEFGHLDLKWYRRTRAWLESEGFIYLADKENLTLAAQSSMLLPVMLRVLRSRDGDVVVALYHPRLRSRWLRVLVFLLRKSLGRIVDLETELTDGHWIMTSNAVQAGKLDSPPLFDAVFVPTRTPLPGMLSAHLERVRGYLAAHPGVAVRPVRSLQEAESAQNRQQALKAAYRGEIGAITLEELKRLSPTDVLAEEVYAEIQQQRQGVEVGS